MDTQRADLFKAGGMPMVGKIQLTLDLNVQAI